MFLFCSPNVYIHLNDDIENLRVANSVGKTEWCRTREHLECVSWEFKNVNQEQSIQNCVADPRDLARQANLIINFDADLDTILPLDETFLSVVERNPYSQRANGPAS